jgi:uncharacterized SAM-binding protein YcdF (DUF218 family)
MKRRLGLKVGAGLLLVLLTLALLAWLFPQTVLTVDSGPVQANVLVVLGGGGLERPARAAELFKTGAAPQVICSGAGDAEPHRAYLIAAGVPATDIQLESRSLTTRENAEFTIALLRAQHRHSAIIVTSWYHSRRALACFEHYAPDLQFFSRPAGLGLPKPGDNQHEIPGYVRAEYAKMLGYWILYGVCPL